MAWGEGSRIPAAVRRAVRRRDDDRCQLAYAGCTGWYEELDHKVNLAGLGIARNDPRAHAIDNLQCVCKHCHIIKTQREALAGRTTNMPRRPLLQPWLQ